MSLAEIDVAVLAGGLGTRIRGVLGDTPKVLAPVDGRPYLDWLLDWLAGAGIRRVVLCLGHLADKVVAWLQAHPRPDLRVEVSIEPEPLGTAGALRHAGAKLGSDPVLVMNGDTFIAADLAALVARHRAAGRDMTVLCVAVPDAGRYGRVELDGRGAIVRFAEKDPAAGPGLINAGIYALGRDALRDIAAGGAESIEREIFMVAEQGAIAAEVSDGAFIDIGTPESLAAAGAAFRAIAAARSRASR